MKKAVRKAAAGLDVVEVRVLMPRAEYDAVKTVCDTYKVDVGDVARNQLGWLLNDHASDPHEEMRGQQYDCKRMRATGSAPGFVQRNEFAAAKAARAAKAAAVKKAS